MTERKPSFSASSRQLLTPVAPARSNSTRHLQITRTNSPSATPFPPRKRVQKVVIGAIRTRRSFSGPRNEADQKIELFFHLPDHTELQRLRVHRSLTLIALQALIQREFCILFEDQRLYYHGDLLEGDEELGSYDIHDQSVFVMRVIKRYRTIGDVFTKIKTVRCLTHTNRNASTSHLTDDFAIHEVVAPLPPLKMIFRHLVIVISYLHRLDRLQQAKTNRRIWKAHVTCWDDPNAGSTTVPRHRRSLIETDKQASDTLAKTSFVLLHSGPERASCVETLAQTHNISQRLQLPPDTRSTADLRHIKRWLNGIKYFASANIPDAVMLEIARACDYVRVPAGEFVFRQGDLGNTFYIVISGCIALAAYGNGYFVTMTPGRCFGEVSLFEGQSGLRTASANVNFAAPFAELATLSSDIYRRAISPYKRAVLQQTEKAIYSIPQFRFLPDHVVTYLAYSSKTLTARTGKRLIRHGDEINVLVLLVQGEVKVSTPKQHLSLRAGTRSPWNMNHEQIDRVPVVSVVCAPAVFGQEGCLANPSTPALWDVDAMDTCTLICIRLATISIFLASRQDIKRALNAEHHHRNEDFHNRFTKAAAELEATFRRRSAFKFTMSQKRASYMRLMSSARLQLSDDGDDSRHGSFSRRKSVATRVAFPKILMRTDDDVSTSSYVAASRKNSFVSQSSQLDTVSDEASEEEQRPPAPTRSVRPPPLSCTDVQDQFLHETLPFAKILSLRDQIRFVSFAQQQIPEGDVISPSSGSVEPLSQIQLEHDANARTRALLHGLRELQAEDVEILSTTDKSESYQFTPRRPLTSPVLSSNVTPLVSTPLTAPVSRRDLKTR
ncbi:hypothetical protein Poli38472_012716 [Pythium oligandrum]|uniref:Cyclic nucleotide-binding domain-containing protein n=1 Tax=Pythium oligandrum TaxID=41045 RepID=A0A8K1CE51_PYTOL|nr:hypothetical protein Poli38472_012716 [Pythium oligandrum]|eukprot:TMW61525.1 hypothetical protein Poli38472_012716 [Pythium oligandrum]